MSKQWCSFCGKEKADVGRLIDGPARIAVCNECIDLMHGMIHDADQPAAGQLAIDLAERRKAKLLGERG